jgi:hypothetical protein
MEKVVENGVFCVVPVSELFCHGKGPFVLFLVTEVWIAIPIGCDC